MKMQPPSKGVTKQKSGIPKPMSKKTKTGFTQNHSVHQRTDSDDCSSSQSSARDPPETTRSTTHHPLAAAMTKKEAAKKDQVSESWADVKIESQSQKMKSLSQSDSSRRKEDLERQLREAESQLGAMSELLVKREKMLEEAKSGAESKIAELEDRLMDQEGVLAEHGIDPVTGQQVPPSEEDKKKAEATKKITKKTVLAMRAKLQEMNRQTESFLADIENTMQYLSSLEDASERAGPFSEETQAMIESMGGDEEAIRRVYSENFSPEKVPSKNPASSGFRESDEEEDGELETKEEHGAGGDGDQFFITRADDEEEEGLVDATVTRQTHRAAAAEDLD